MSGKLIVCEGLDCSGKTTATKQLTDSDPSYVYCKGIGSDSIVGRFALKHPSTCIFLSELAYNTYTRIIPNLRKDKIVLQDRYDISISSFIPNTNRWYNQLLIRVTGLLIPKPDAIVYLHLPLEERIKRLKQKATKYELMLAENPTLITLREKEYEKWYENFVGPKIKIDTQETNTKQTTKILEEFIQNI